MKSLELNENVINLLIKALSNLEGSESTTFEEDEECIELREELEENLCNIHMKRCH